MKRYLITSSLFLLLCFLLLAPKTAAAAARDGLTLWYQNLVPVLFPFMILSNLMIRLDCISILLKFLHPLLHFVWGTSVYGSYAILAGFLFGYPMGAKVIGDLCQKELITPEEAEYLIGFVNNLSPAFLITYLVGQNLKKPLLLHPTLCILYGAPLISSIAFLPKYRKKIRASSVNRKKASRVPLQPELIDACIFDGIINITRLGGYIMLFTLITGALSLLPFKHALVQCLITGCIEITVGIQTICESTLPFLTKYLCLMMLCSFGGICALLQTLSVYKMSRQTLFHYIKAKTLTMGIAAFMTLLLFL